MRAPIMNEFRIIPRQAPELIERGHRGYGFIFENKILCWHDFRTAMIAAFILRLGPEDISPIGVIFAEEDKSVSIKWKTEQ